MKRLLPLLLLLGACRGAETSQDLLQVDERALGGVSTASAKNDGVVFERLPLKLPNGTVIQAELASTPAAREKGLMFRESLESDYGMLFAFSTKRFLTFWMKNTFVDLDMVFLDENKRISGIHARVPKSRKNASDDEVARRSGVGRYVLELPAGAAEGYGLAPGQQLTFTIP